MLSGTFLLYLFIMVSSTFLAAQSQKRRKDGSVKFIKGYFVAAFLIHWFFIAFTRTGTDHEEYLIIIERDAVVYMTRGLEVGFNGLCILLYNLFGDGEKCIFVIKSITTVLFYISFYMLRKKTDLWLVVLAFNVWEFFSSMYIIAHAMAIALVMIGTAFIILEKKWYLPLIMAALAYTIHASALVLFVVFGATTLMNKMNVRTGKFIVVMSMFLTLVILMNLREVFGFATTRIDTFEQYANGVTAASTGVGIFNYVLYFYIFGVIVYPLLESNLPVNIRNVSFMLFIFGFISAVMGYFLPTARLNQYTLALYAFVVPLYFHEINLNLEHTHRVKDLSLKRASWVLVLLFFGYGAISNATNPTSTSELYNYELFNPFK